jgi:hypothetical protein
MWVKKKTQLDAYNKETSAFSGSVIGPLGRLANVPDTWPLSSISSSAVSNGMTAPSLSDRLLHCPIVLVQVQVHTVLLFGFMFCLTHHHL